MFVKISENTYFNIDNIETMKIVHNKMAVEDGKSIIKKDPVLIISLVSGEVFEYWKEDCIDVMERILRTVNRAGRQ